MKYDFSTCLALSLCLSFCSIDLGVRGCHAVCVEEDVCALNLKGSLSLTARPFQRLFWLFSFSIGTLESPVISKKYQNRIRILLNFLRKLLVGICCKNGLSLEIGLEQLINFSQRAAGKTTYALQSVLIFSLPNTCIIL